MTNSAKSITISEASDKDFALDLYVL